MNSDPICRVIGLAVIIVGCAISAGFTIMALAVTGNTSDFTVIWAAGTMDTALVYDHAMVTAAQGPITGLSGGHVRPFVYPPSALLLFRPLAWLPFEFAYPLWIALLASAFGLAARQGFGWPTVGLSLITPPLIYGLWAGQPSILVAAIILFCVPHITRRPVLAGVAMGIGAAIKPQGFVLVPIALLATRNWRAAIGFAAGALGPVAISALFWPRLWVGWIDALASFPAIVRDLGLGASGVSPAAIAPAIGLPEGVGWAIRAMGVMLGLLLVWVSWTRSKDHGSRTTGLIGGTLLVSPYAMPYELAGLMPTAIAALLGGRLVLGLSVLPPLAKFAFPVAAVALIRGKTKEVLGEDPNLDRPRRSP